MILICKQGVPNVQILYIEIIFPLFTNLISNIVTPYEPDLSG